MGKNLEAKMNGKLRQRKRTEWWWSEFYLHYTKMEDANWGNTLFKQHD